MKDKKFLQQIGRSYTNITNGIVNIWRWRKVIWNDRWWDHYYFYEIISFKLKDMESHWGKDTCGANDKDVKIILQSLIDDLKLLQNNKFVEKELQELDLKYGKVDLVRQKNHNGKNTLQLKREKETDENCDEIQTRTIEIYTIETKRRTQTKKRFFDTLRDNVETFWD
jgi:hypothetical protein